MPKLISVNNSVGAKTRQFRQVALCWCGSIQEWTFHIPCEMMGWISFKILLMNIISCKRIFLVSTE